MALTATSRLFAAGALALLAGHALADAQVLFSSGGASAVDRDGRSRALAKGGAVRVGDTIRTRAGARMQIRFEDGMLLSLQPRSVLAITGASAFALRAGALRVASPGGTGGREVRFDTASGSVSASGGGAVQVKDDGSMVVMATAGRWRIENAAGDIVLPVRQPVQSLAQDTPPALSDGPPAIPPPPLREERLGAGVAAAPFPGAEWALFGGALGGRLDERGQPARLDAGGYVYSRESGSEVRDAGRDELLAWGRWTGPVRLSGEASGQYDFAANEGLHYVVGAPSAALPTSGRATYTLLGATSPTWSSLGPPGGGERSAGTFSGSLTVDFAAAAARIGIDFLVQMPTGGYALNGSTSTASASFALSPSVTGTGGACAFRCTAGVAGFFAGRDAERAGVGYRITDQDVAVGAQYPTIQGTAAFTRK